MRRIFFFLFFIYGSLFAEECDYAFQGNHFIASYYGCSYEALLNIKELQKTMIQASKNSGAGILDYSDYQFQGGGYTLVILLSESHASIHTYPEHHACFVDLFTCGDHCSHEVFNEALSTYLKPADAHVRTLVRK